MAAPRFNPIVSNLELGVQGARNALGIKPASEVQWVYRPNQAYINERTAENNRLRNMGLIFGAPYNPQSDNSLYFDPVSGMSRNDYENWANTTALNAINEERARMAAVRDFMNSTQGNIFDVQNQYDLFSGRQINPDYFNAPSGDSYRTSFPSGFTAPTVNDPLHGKAYQDAYTQYYSQFAPVNYSNLNAYAPELFGGDGRINYQVNANLFSQAELDAVRNNPELYDFATRWNAEVAKAADWTVQLVNPYSPYLGSRVEGYEAPILNQTERYGVKFGGNPGAQAIGNTNDNPIPDTPGAGLWVYGIDPQNPDQLARAWEQIFVKNTDEGAKRALADFAPTQNPDGSWRKVSSLDELYNFAGALDSYYRGLAQRIDLPKRGIMDSIAGKIILGGLTSAFTGGLGSIVGGLTGNAAIGNIASTLASAGIGGATGGLQGAITGGLGSAVGAGVDYAGGVGEFIRNPLDSLAGAFDVGAGAVGGGVGGLLLDDMDSVAQIGPGSLAANTPTPGLNLGGPTVMSTDLPSSIANEIVTVTASAPGATSSFGWLPSTLAAIGVPLGSQLLVNESGNLTGWRPPDGGPIGLVIGAGTPPDFVNGQPTGNPVGGTGQGGVAETGGGTGGQAQAGGGTGGTSVIGGAATGGLLTPGTGTATIGSGTTGAGVGGAGGDIAGVGGAGDGGIAQGGAGTGTTGGTTGGSVGLLDENVTPGGATGGTGGATGGTGGVTGGTGTTSGGVTGGTTGGVTGGTTGGTTGIEFGSPAYWDAVYANMPRPPTGQPPTQPEYVPPPEYVSPETKSADLMNQVGQLFIQGVNRVDGVPTNPSSSWANSGTGQVRDFVTPRPQPSGPAQFGSEGWLNEAIATQATTSPMLPVNPVNSWANSGTGQVQDFATPQTQTAPQFGSEAWLNAILAGAGLGAAGVGLAGLGGSSPVNGWAFSGTGTPQDFVTPGLGGGTGLGTDLGGGLGGGTGSGTGLDGGAGLGGGTGLGDGTGLGTGTGLGDGTGGNGTGDGDGLGGGIGAGLGGLLTDTAPIVDQAVQPTNNPFDFGFPDLSMFSGGTPGGLGEATGSGIYGGKMGGFQAKYPKTPKKKKRGITVQIAGARRNG